MQNLKLGTGTPSPASLRSGGTQPARAGWVRAATGSSAEDRRSLAQLLACDRDAVQEAAFAVVVVDREVAGRAVAQKAERAFPPLEAAGEFGPDRVTVEIIEQRARLLLGPALEAHGEPRIDVKRLAAGVGVADDDRMHGVLRRELGVANAALEVAPPRRRRGAEDVAARMQCPEPLEGRFQTLRQRVIGCIHAGEQCVAAGLRHLARIEHRPQSRRLVIRMVGMPAIADIALLLRLLAHLGDHRVPGTAAKKRLTSIAPKERANA